MGRSWSFGHKLGAGMALLITLTVVTGAVSVFALRDVVQAKDRVITVHAQNLIDAERLRGAFSSKVAVFRGYILVGHEDYLGRLRESRQRFAASVAALRKHVGSEDDRQALLAMEKAEAEHEAAIQRAIAARKAGADLAGISRQLDTEALPMVDRLLRAIDGLIHREELALSERQREASQSASFSITLILLVVFITVVQAVVGGIVFARSVTRQINKSVGHVESSARELQAAAGQQAASSREQTIAVKEITTTITELLASARQIAHSAQRVAVAANDTAEAALTGDHQVVTTQEAVQGIRRQVDVIVGHMLDLGKRSQQIGGILDIINELAEQTNILSINATIEAVGAGEAGKRFAVVAEEIRKLADRVGGSTREIRNLIEEIRAAVNTTVMATEGGAKAVDAGARQFGEVAATFGQITNLLAATAEAAKEIQLSTSQQTTAIEQVNVAMLNVAQAARETEQTAAETALTASELSGLSQSLNDIVRSKAKA